MPVDDTWADGADDALSDGVSGGGAAGALGAPARFTAGDGVSVGRARLAGVSDAGAAARFRGTTSAPGAESAKRRNDAGGEAGETREIGGVLGAFSVSSLSCGTPTASTESRYWSSSLAT